MIICYVTLFSNSSLLSIEISNSNNIIHMWGGPNNSKSEKLNKEERTEEDKAHELSKKTTMKI